MRALDTWPALLLLRLQLVFHGLKHGLVLEHVLEADLGRSDDLAGGGLLGPVHDSQEHVSPFIDFLLVLQVLRQDVLLEALKFTVQSGDRCSGISSGNGLLLALLGSG